MINSDFYPTPTNVIEQMLDGIQISGKAFLEPSAGNGNIVDALIKKGAKQVLFCEIEPDLAVLASKKGGQFMKGDFLKVEKEQVSHISAIIMNPPFSADEKHILHAWNIAPSGCVIVALCNTNTLEVETRWGTRKELCETINSFGTRIDLGSCFQDAERKTNVEVSMVHLYKPAQAGEYEFDGYFDMFEEAEQQQENGIMKHNEIRAIVNSYVGAVKMFDYVFELESRINEMIEPLNGRHSLIKFGAFQSTGRDITQLSRGAFKKELQKKAWLSIFGKMDMERYVTRKLQGDINKFVEMQVNVPFTMTNIYRMFELIAGTNSQRMKAVLLEVFERICSYSAENSTAGQSWKTNSNYMINKRFIIPYAAEMNYSGKMSIDYRNRDEIDDIVKAIYYLKGLRWSGTDSISNWLQYWRNGLEFGQWYEFGVFRLKGFKKRTLHFEFVNQDDWTIFNIEVAKIKGWKLPATTKTHVKNAF